MAEQSTIGGILPSWKEFKKDKLGAILYGSLVVIGYLYVDVKVAYNKRDNEKQEAIQECKQEKNAASNENTLLKDQLRRRDSAMAYMTAMLSVLNPDKKIQ